MKVLHNPHTKESRELINQLKQSDFNDFEIINYPDCVDEYPYITKYPAVLIYVPQYTDDIEEINVQPHEEYATSRDITSEEVADFCKHICERERFLKQIISGINNFAELRPDIPEQKPEFQIAQRPEYSDIR